MNGTQGRIFKYEMRQEVLWQGVSAVSTFSPKGSL